MAKAKITISGVAEYAPEDLHILKMIFVNQGPNQLSNANFMKLAFQELEEEAKDLYLTVEILEDNDTALLFRRLELQELWRKND